MVRVIVRPGRRAEAREHPRARRGGALSRRRHDVGLGSERDRGGVHAREAEGRDSCTMEGQRQTTNKTGHKHVGHAFGH